MLNLDCESREYLRELWDKKGKQNAADCFPDKPRGYIKAFNDYRAYAINKVCAIDCRLKGDIASAINYERMCDNIYNSLPDFAQW